jgi:uncharacterized protein (TIGR00661 family)
MADAFARVDADVTWLFSGRDRDGLFDMEPFGEFEHRRGLTFATVAGKISRTKTVLNNNLFEFFADVSTLDLSRYDLLVTDYEPVLAWAARRAGRECLGIGHQYAFGPGTPVCGATPATQLIMQRFAPVSTPLGLHWHPYADNVLPPILDLPPLSEAGGEHVLVYLPFEDQDQVTDLLRAFPGQRFVQYVGKMPAGVMGNVVRKSASIHTFKQDLARARAVICNSGFELISECLQWHKPVLTRPLAGQMEQLSNALALQQLGYARVAQDLDQMTLGRWLEQPVVSPGIHFPDVAAALADWLVGGCRVPVPDLCHGLWRETRSATMSLAAGLQAA